MYVFHNIYEHRQKKSQQNEHTNKFSHVIFSNHYINREEQIPISKKAKLGISILCNKKAIKTFCGFEHHFKII